MISDVMNVKGENLVETGKQWLSNKRHGTLNIVTSAVFFRVFGNLEMNYFHEIGWKNQVYDIDQINHT